jgi:predicted transposase YbfD/YdcC
MNYSITNSKPVIFQNFLKALATLKDVRDNRGKIHTYAFIITSMVFAIMSGRSTLSGIHRYIKNNIVWLRRITKMPQAAHISRAHLPRFICKLCWKDINVLIEVHFKIRIDADIKHQWVAIDGKVMRGTIKNGDQQTIIHAVLHNSREEVAQARQIGKKSSEIPVVREMIQETGLEKGDITLDALHCNPKTTSQINQAGGSYLIQVKENQAMLLAECKRLHKEASHIGVYEDIEKAHGRLTARSGSSYKFRPANIDSRWKASDIKTLVVVKRETLEISSNKETEEISYYITNKSVDSADSKSSEDLFNAVRKHWGVESNNWILDCAFNEDNIKIKSGNQSQVLGRIRGLCCDLMRRSGVIKFKEAIDGYVDSRSLLVQMLRQVKFL